MAHNRSRRVVGPPQLSTLAGAAFVAAMIVVGEMEQVGNGTTIVLELSRTAALWWVGAHAALVTAMVLIASSRIVVRGDRLVLVNLVRTTSIQRAAIHKIDETGDIRVQLVSGRAYRSLAYLTPIWVKYHWGNRFDMVSRALRAWLAEGSDPGVSVAVGSRPAAGVTHRPRLLPLLVFPLVFTALARLHGL